MEITSQHRFLGTEFTWIACDKDGHIGAFCITLDGPAPVAAVESGALMDTAYEALDGLAPCGRAITASSARGNTHYSERLAARGIFAFDWDSQSGCYLLTSKPTALRQLFDIRDRQVREAVKLIRFTNPFGQMTALSREALARASEPLEGTA